VRLLPKLRHALALALTASFVFLVPATPAAAYWQDKINLDGGLLYTALVSLQIPPSGHTWYRPDGRVFTPGSDVLGAGEIIHVTVPFHAIVSGTTMEPWLEISGIEFSEELRRKPFTEVSETHSDVYGNIKEAQPGSIEIRLAVDSAASACYKGTANFTHTSAKLDSGRIWFDTAAVDLGVIDISVPGENCGGEVVDPVVPPEVSCSELGFPDGGRHLLVGTDSNPQAPCIDMNLVSVIEISVGGTDSNGNYTFKDNGTVTLQSVWLQREILAGVTHIPVWSVGWLPELSSPAHFASNVYGTPTQIDNNIGYVNLTVQFDPVWLTAVAKSSDPNAGIFRIAIYDTSDTSYFAYVYGRVNLVGPQ